MYYGFALDKLGRLPHLLCDGLGQSLLCGSALGARFFSLVKNGPKDILLLLEGPLSVVQCYLALLQLDASFCHLRKQRGDASEKDADDKASRRAELCRVSPDLPYGGRDRYFQFKFFPPQPTMASTCAFPSCGQQGTKVRLCHHRGFRISYIACMFILLLVLRCNFVHSLIVY